MISIDGWGHHNLESLVKAVALFAFDDINRQGSDIIIAAIDILKDGIRVMISEVFSEFSHKNCLTRGKSLWGK